MNTERILVTAALPYANGPIHLGHLAGAYLPADMYVRYHRLKGSDILFVCGSDEHGVPVTITADKEGITPQDVIDRFHSINQESFRKFGMDFDIYSRTSIPAHHETAKEFFKKYYELGLLSEKKSMQFYDPKAAMFLPDRYVEGTCPNCGNTGARSDECEVCGALYDPNALKNPISKITGETPVLKESSHWYFPLGKYQERLEKYIADHNKQYGWRENVLQYCQGWFQAGLQDRAVTRDLDWGVAVPLDHVQNKVLYVWFEAVLGYISATKELSAHRSEPELWKEFWLNKETKYVAFIGKDNIVFHTIVFPAMLMAWNDASAEQYILPQNVPANEFLNFEGKKFSKSRNWGIDVIDFLKLFDADSLRYTLASNLPEYRDTDFQWKEFQAKHNNELANILGNFVHRTLTFLHKHFEGVVPQVGTLTELDAAQIQMLQSSPSKISELFEGYRFKEATLELMNICRASNKYFNDAEPWKLVKSDKEACGTVLNVCLQTIYTMAELFMPVIPFTSEKLFRILNARPVLWNECGTPHLDAGHQINSPEILFVQIEDTTIEKVILETANTVEPVAEAKAEVPTVEPLPPVTYDDFMKVQLLTAEVLSAEKIKGKDKLLKLNLSVAGEERQVVAGIALSYTPEQIIGKKVVIVANLEPKKIAGQTSHGMILAADNGKGGLQILEVGDVIPSGIRVK